MFQQKGEMEKQEKNKYGKMLAFAKTEVKDIVMGWAISHPPPNSYAEVLTPSIS